MTFGERVKKLRQGLGLSQESFGAQGFVSTPGWIKIENGQRQASEKLIDKLVTWLVGGKYVRANASSSLKEELLTLKYMGSNSAFVRELAKAHAKTSPSASELLAEGPATSKAKTGARRAPAAKKAK